MALYKRVIVVFVGALCIFGVFRQLHSVFVAVPAIADIENLPVIVIDPGHGGIDGGAVGVNNIVEKDINLAIALVLRDMLLASGFDVVMTRDTDISIHDEDARSIRAQKTSDLHNRLAIAQSNPNSIFLSIHQNKFGQASSNGTQVFYSPNNSASEELAGILQTNIAAWLQPDNRRQFKKAGKNLYLMYEAECPAVLVECGFISNSAEAHRLEDKEYQSQLAFAIMASVMQYLELDIPAEINNN